MSYTETYAGAFVVLDLDADGILKAGNVEQVWTATVNGNPLPDIKKRVVLDAAMLAGIIPDQASLLIQVNDLKAERDAANAAKDAAEADKAAAIAQAETEKAALQSQIDALNAQLHPVDANGFPILSAVQVRLALLGAGITPAMVEAAIESLPAGIEHDTARTYWEYAVQFNREHPFIAAFAAALGLTSEQVDTMWHAAAGIV